LTWDTVNQKIEDDERALVDAKERLAALEAQQEEQVPAVIEQPPNLQPSNVELAGTAVREAVAKGVPLMPTTSHVHQHQVIWTGCISQQIWSHIQTVNLSTLIRRQHTPILQTSF